MEYFDFELMFQQPKPIDFINVDFDFDICLDHFIEWLKQEGEEVFKDNYSLSVQGMCEYSCLYLAMMLNGKKLEGDMRIIVGRFGLGSHYWISYLFRGETYFIDLTMQQFNPSAPKVAISKYSKGMETDYLFYEDEEYETINDYIERQRAFNFYVNPHNIFA